jgi:hypothetical protein
MVMCQLKWIYEIIELYLDVMHLDHRRPALTMTGEIGCPFFSEMM